MRLSGPPIASMRLLIWSAVPALTIAACGSSSPSSSILLAGALTAQTNGGEIIQCGVESRTRTQDATTFELQLRVHMGKSLDRLIIVIHDGAGGPGTYRVRPVHGPLTFRVYLADAASESATTRLAASLRAVVGVVNVRYESKDDAAAEAAANDPDLAEALATLGSNPLPASLVVSVVDTQAIPTVETTAAASPLLDSGPPEDIGVNTTHDPRGIGEVALYSPEAHATAAGAQPDYEAEGTLTLNRDGRSGSVFAELVSSKGTKVGVTGSFAC